MLSIYSVFKCRFTRPPWNNKVPVREELFSIERLEQHAKSLAAAQKVMTPAPRVQSLHSRLNDNATVLLAAYRASAAELEEGGSVVPAAEWLLDNYHLVEEQIREIKDDLPAGFYRQLPKLASGPFAGYPRVFGLAWAFVAHTDSFFDADSLCRFIAAYQEVEPLTIGELWAVAITIRIVLVENLRRLADQITLGRAARADADRLTHRLLASGNAESALASDIATRSSGPITELFAAQLAKRLRDQDPKTTPALEWLEHRLRLQNLTVEQVVQHAQQRQGASNVTIRNVITSMRLISDIDWAALFERVSLVDQCLSAGSRFVEMNFCTRNLYRSAIEQLARGSNFTELQIAERVLARAQVAATQVQGDGVNNDIERERLGDPGFYLIDRGRIAFEQTIAFKPTVRLTLSRVRRRFGLSGYLSLLALTTVGLLVLGAVMLRLVAPSLMPAELSLFAVVVGAFLALIALIPASEIATVLVNRFVCSSHGAMTLPELDFKNGVPTASRTFIAVPSLLTNSADIKEQIERLEIHYLSGVDGDLSFGLLVDGVDAEHEHLANDKALLDLAIGEVEKLNQRYPAGPAGKRFLLLNRRRVFNAAENTWMGWERKRGKLHELNRLLRGATDTTFVVDEKSLAEVPKDVRYVITLDADTRLPRDAAIRLIGKIAHPLNRPQFCQHTQRVIAGYGILQPRVTPSLSIGQEGSLYQRVFSSPGGIDPYAAATSDVYQDLFGQGSFTGKGIYDIDVFEAAMNKRVPENAMLSHDLFEGIYARAGLVSDVEVIEEFPSRYDVAVKRQHRWTRGDWQLMPWIFPWLFYFSKSNQIGAAQVLPALGRWKMMDNLRRSLLAPLTLASLVLAWCLPPVLALSVTLLVLTTVIIPPFFSCLFSLLPMRRDADLKNHLRMWGKDLRLAAWQSLLNLAFLPDTSWRMLDAIARSSVRLLFTRKHMLEWTTAALANDSPRLSVLGFYQKMAQGTVLSTLLCLVVIVLTPSLWWLVLPFLLLWTTAPVLALWVSQSPSVVSPNKLHNSATALRLIARRTWRYFETFVTPADNMLPPDNFQEDPEPVIARRTSPTNIGLYMLSAVTARDFGWLGTLDAIERLEATFASLQKMPRYKGHFFNWYATETLQTLLPAYVSSVDSGNLAGHLIALANACDEWQSRPRSLCARQGITDNLRLAQASIKADRVVSAGQTPSAHAHPLLDTIEEIIIQLSSQQSFIFLAPVLVRLTDKAVKLAHSLEPTFVHNLPSTAVNSLSFTVTHSLPVTFANSLQASAGPLAEAIFWLEAARKNILEHQRDHDTLAHLPNAFTERLQALAKTARATALAMDFAFLLDPDRNLLSIGYDLAENRLDANCYDLLASEARLASLFAIAKGDVASKHWFHLGRTATPLGKGSALISWSGSMFEYLMPSLVMRAPVGSLLEQTNRLIVARQQQYGQQWQIPWGVSESAYSARDIELTYQYANFGVPGLGLKRGLSENRVIAPYATGLATMVDPQAALENYQHLANWGASGRFGFYEALDFTPSRLPEAATVAMVKCYMAHHQGMTIVAIANALHEGKMRAYFHREPIIRACELLLQERMPRDVIHTHPRAEEVKVASKGSTIELPAPRRLSALAAGSPLTHLLSNGRYAVMLTAAGGGYSRWGDIAITRWKEDTTRDDYGTYVFMRDIHTGKRWSCGVQPIAAANEYRAGLFEEDHAEFSHQDGDLTTTMEVIVSGEDDGEVRRISLVNSGRVAREIELTSYAELVLTGVAADNAHPAFAKMFVQTEFMPEFGALVATRRVRSDQDAKVWAAHFAIVEGDISADFQYESSRALFVGRNKSINNAAAFDRHDDTQNTQLHASTPLSGTLGTVLDPIFALRYRVKVPAGGKARVAFWTVAAATREALLNLIDRHHDRNAFDRAKTLSWTQAQVQLRHLSIGPSEAADFQRIAAPILYADPHFRAPSEAIVRGAGPQSALWSHGISGDLPIVLLQIDDIEDIAQVKQLLRAHEYWRIKRLAVDLVIINEHASSYVQDLQIAIDTAVRSSQSRTLLKPEFAGELVKSSVYVLRADLIPTSTRNLLKSIARVVLVARHGSLAQQIARLALLFKSANAAQKKRHSQPRLRVASIDANPTSERVVSSPLERFKSEDLEFFNGLGGFANDGQEYCVVLDKGVSTPAPWINVIANAGFGFQVAAEGSGYTWAENSRENQLTSWSNDPVANPAGEVIYVRDEDSHEVFCATAAPINDQGKYIAHHGRGFSRFEHHAHGIGMALTQFVPLADPIKISRLQLTNHSDKTRRLLVTSYTEWVLGLARGSTGPFMTTEYDDGSGALMIQNPWNISFAGRVGFADMGGKQTSWTTDRREFLGRNGQLNAPLALQTHSPLSGFVGAGHDPCTAQQYLLELAPGESREVVVFMGQCSSLQKARALVRRYREQDLDAVFAEVQQHWRTLLGAVQVKTPDRAMDIMLNGWLLYQTMACRIVARSAFYQASGAYGFRDQLQDGMALTFSRPDLTRAHILRAAGRQFVAGDVQHWWLPHSGQGVRTRISDDRVWLAFATATYIQTSGDKSILDEPIAFLDGPKLAPEEHDAYFQPMVSDTTASLREHCARGLDQCLTLTGELGMPLMGSGDWNDGMNRVGGQGKGESVWLGWLLIRTIELFTPIYVAAEADASAVANTNANLEADNDDTSPDTSLRPTQWREHAERVRAAIEKQAWDGDWYKRATFDDGTWLGSKDSDECRIDSIAQSWAVLSGVADAKRAAKAMASVETHLIKPELKLALLFTPPFDKTPLDPGYIKGYPPGLRENGGQYSHAAMWAMFAFSQLGQGQKAHDLFALLNPINHALNPDESQRYCVEPYVLAADVYSVAPHIGRGGWTWYTGAAGWMYRAGVEAILGISREGDELIIAPCIPADWPEFSATVTIESSHYAIVVKKGNANVGLKAVCDGLTLILAQSYVRVPLDGKRHQLQIDLAGETLSGLNGPHRMPKP